MIVDEKKLRTIKSLLLIQVKTKFYLYLYHFQLNNPNCCSFGGHLEWYRVIFMYKIFLDSLLPLISKTIWGMYSSKSLFIFSSILNFFLNQTNFLNKDTFGKNIIKQSKLYYFLHSKMKNRWNKCIY